MFSKKMAAQEDLVRKAAYTNVSYGKRLEDLTMGLKQKHNDVTAAKRQQLAAEDMADELRIQLGKVEKEFEMHREDSVDAQVHKVVVREKEQAEKRMGLLRDEIRTLRREMSFNSGQYEGVIEKLDAEFAATKEKLDTKIAEEAEALKHGGTAMQKLKMQVEALELKKRELHAIARSAEKKCKAAETKAEEMEMNQTALQTEAKRAKHAKAFAEEEKAKAVIEATEAKEALYTAVREADVRGAQTRAELEFVKEELQKVEQQRTMVVQLLGLLRRLQNRTKEQPLAEELQDCKGTHAISLLHVSPGTHLTGRFALLFYRCGVSRCQPGCGPGPAVDRRGGVFCTAAGTLRHAPRRSRRPLLLQHCDERIQLLPPGGQLVPEDRAAVREPNAGGRGATDADASAAGARRVRSHRSDVRGDAPWWRYAGQSDLCEERRDTGAEGSTAGSNGRRLHHRGFVTAYKTMQDTICFPLQSVKTQ